MTPFICILVPKSFLIPENFKSTILFKKYENIQRYKKASFESNWSCTISMWIQYCPYSSNQKRKIYSHMAYKHKVESWFWNRSTERKQKSCYLLSSCSFTENYFISEIFDSRILRFILVLNNLVAHIAKRLWNFLKIWKDTLGFILEKNHSVVLIVHILPM